MSVTLKCFSQISNPKHYIMKKIVIFWNAGSWKSTFAVKLAKKLWIPAHHLDKELLREHRTRVDAEKESAIVQKIIDQPTRIVEWNYLVSFEQRILAADTLIYLDIPRMRCIRNVIIRMLKYRFFKVDRPDIGVNKEKWLDFGFYKWIRQFPRVRGNKIFAILNKHHKQIIRIRSHNEANRFVNSIE